jgi:adenylate cyclase
MMPTKAIGRPPAGGLSPVRSPTVSAARETLAALKAYRAPGEEAPLRMVIALHYGTVIYGNIGAADRLDFTVIGPAVNLVSRAEAIAKSLDEPLVVTDEIATLLGGPLRSLGRSSARRMLTAMTSPAVVSPRR